MKIQSTKKIEEYRVELERIEQINIKLNKKVRGQAKVIEKQKELIKKLRK